MTFLGIAAGRDDGVAGGQRRLRDVDAQTTACAGDEPNLLVSHGMRLWLWDLSMAMTVGRLTEKKKTSTLNTV